MKSITANFTITLKTTDRFGRPETVDQAVILDDNTQEELDRGFAFIRKLYPTARKIERTGITKYEERA